MAYPLLVGFSSIPKVAVVPIFVLWFGAGTVPAMLTAMILCVFPIVVNVATGLATTEPELEDVMKALKASKLDILSNVGLPRTMPYFFASLKVAVTQAFVGTVIAETVASNRGIGNLMMIASSSFDVPLVFAGLLILAALGVALYVIFSLIEGRVTGWAPSQGRIRDGLTVLLRTTRSVSMPLLRMLGAFSVIGALALSGAAAQEPTKVRFTLDWKYQGIHAYVFWAAGEGLLQSRRPRCRPSTRAQARPRP